MRDLFCNIVIREGKGYELWEIMEILLVKWANFLQDMEISG